MRRICTTSDSAFRLLDEHGFNCFVGPDMEIYTTDADYEAVSAFLSDNLPFDAFFTEHVPGDEFNALCDSFDFLPPFVD